VQRLRRWLRPTTGLSGWLVVVFLGELLVALAGALLLRQLFREVPAGSPAGQAFNVATLQFLPDWMRVVLVLVIGIGVFVYGLRRLMDVLLEPFPDRTQPLVELVYQKRSLARGPRVVAIGGGTGQSTLLRGLKEHSSNITAIVSVADDGGSSGMLRQEMGIAPVGDIRNCIAALADAEPTMTRLLQYRFPTEPGADQGVGGHAFGNLLIAALSDIAQDFEEGVRLSNRVLAVRGQVLPVAAEPLTLHAELADGRELAGQSRIMRIRGIRRVWISPDHVTANADALDAIRSADLVVLGPGSLYTSLLPNLLVPGGWWRRSRRRAVSGCTSATSRPRWVRRRATPCPSTWPRSMRTTWGTSWTWSSPMATRTPDHRRRRTPRSRCGSTCPSAVARRGWWSPM
jgi:hypothetical protein